MCRFRERLLGFCLALIATATVSAGTSKPAGYYGYGQPAAVEQIAGWDIDVRPDGQGLPPGSGSAEDGEPLYEAQCAECHGSFGEAVGRYPALAGGEGSLSEARPHKTVGSYWAYTSTLWDYIHRAMPFTRPESLSDDEVYALTAYVLYLNDLVEDDFVLTRDNLASVELPNAGNFVPDQRPDVHNTRCMSDCRDPAAIQIKSEAPLYFPKNTAKVAKRAAVTAAGQETYARSCALCHDKGIAGAPRVGDHAAWALRMGQGIEVVYDHAIKGFEGDVGRMPPKGGFVGLSDEAVKVAVDYMLEQSQ
ncbi:MAG: cytochrome c5 [Halieaceae bacterium]|jgi:cytochrome c5